MPSLNPFEPLSPASLARVYQWPDEALRFLAREFECLHVVADCGMGKTTLLRQIEQRVVGEGQRAWYVCVPLDGGLRLEPPPGGPLALLDETDRLSGRALTALLRRLRKEGCRCALAGHRSQLREIRRAGFAAEYLELRALTSAQAVRSLFESRVDLAPGDTAPSLTEPAAEALLRASRGNLERCLQIGYEVFEDLEALRDITAADIEAAAASLDLALAGGEASR
jgi:hypothetical protein